MTTKYLTQKNAARKVRALTAGLAIAFAGMVANSAHADTIVNIPGGYIHTWTGDHGETFQVIRNTNKGTSVTMVDRHDGRRFVPFTPPPKPVLVKPITGSLYNPDTNTTTTIVRGPRGSATTVENGNTLREHGNWMPQPTRGRISGSAYDPETNSTTTQVSGPTGAVRMVEKGNTMDQHRDMAPPKYTGHVSGSAYDPQTNRTTTIVARPGMYGRMVEAGNTLSRH